jgi:thiol peroxidase
MANVKFAGEAVETIGTLPQVGSVAPDFTLTKNDLSDAKLSDYRGKRVVLNIFPSLDTGVCAQSVRTFNKRASELDNTAVLCISADLPFAQARFCGAEGLDRVETLSTFRSPDFGKDYGCVLTSGALKGLMSRCVVVLDEEGKVLYTEQVAEMTNEPNYDAAIAAL